MNERLTNSFAYEHCDVPRDESLAEWRTRQAPPSRRRTQVTSGLIAAVATLTPIVLSVRGTRGR